MSELYIGLISGTSIDGLDGVLVDFAAQTPRLRAALHQEMPPTLRAALREAARAGHVELERVGRAGTRLAELEAELVQRLLASAGAEAADVAAIGSHGQTIRHCPDGEHPFTLQLDDPSLLAERTAITVVGDLRRRDMAAGGQAAPLVPAFHAARFRSRGSDRVVLNLGGIANVTLLPADPRRAVSGFDTGPANTLLDAWAQHHLGTPMDTNGRWGRGGRPVRGLLTRLRADAYFKRPPPKSTGPEHFNLDWLRSHLRQHASRDVQATLGELTAVTVADAIAHHLPGTREVLVCGGGAYNPWLMERLAANMPEREVVTTAQHGLEPRWVEAAAFAWLARQTLTGQPGNLPAVTGAQRPVVLGGIYPGGRD